ncbi:glycosyltransferase family 32 protein, partial [Lactobacillus kefiranofaciens]
TFYQTGPNGLFIFYQVFNLILQSAKKINYIPKRIYYVWLEKNPLPKVVQKNLKNWKEVNPDFKIIRIDESNFDIKKYKYIEEAYRDKNWAFASDVVRLDIIYNYGGFYFDTDVFLKKYKYIM